MSFKKKLEEAGLKAVRNMIETESKLSIRAQCDLLGLHRSGLYYHQVAETAENLRIMRLLDERYLNYPTGGVLQMQDYLRTEGYQVNHKRIRRLLRKMGIMAIFPKRNLSKLGKAGAAPPNISILIYSRTWISITAIRSGRLI
jgi:putative transposase